MAEQVPIIYREFYDFPRLFMVSYRGVHFLFDGSFDAERDEYPEHYTVYQMPPLAKDVLDESWSNVPRLALHRLGSIPITRVAFDRGRRTSVSSDVLDEVISTRDRSKPSRGVE